MVLSWDSCDTQLGFLCYSVGIPVVLVWDSSGTKGLPFAGDFFAIRLHFLRHLEYFSLFVTSHVNVQMVIAQEQTSVKADARRSIGRNIV